MNDLDPTLLDQPRLNADLPPLAGSIKSEPSDFVVEELPAYEPCGEGPHMYLWVEKVDVSAKELLRRLSRHFDVDKADIGMAGMKDRRAVTRQWISVPVSDDASEQQFVGRVDELVEVLEARRHGNKLKTGHLRGNRFLIRVRNVAEADPAQLTSWTERLATGVPNYYGDQRFGRDNETVRVGLSVLRGDERKPRDRWFARLALSAAQSAVFNRVVAARVKEGLLRTALQGDRLNRVGVRGQLLVGSDDLEQGQEAIDTGAAVPTGPMFGPKMYPTQDTVLQRELAALAEFGLTEASFAKYARLCPGTRRDALIRPEELTLEVVGADAINVGFSLPSGAYATVVLREFIQPESPAR